MHRTIVEITTTETDDFENFLSEIFENCDGSESVEDYKVLSVDENKFTVEVTTTDYEDKDDVKSFIMETLEEWDEIENINIKQIYDIDAGEEELDGEAKIDDDDEEEEDDEDDEDNGIDTD